MADCGASGTALDRAVSAAVTAGGLGHAGMAHTATGAAMPAAPPTTLGTQASTTIVAMPPPHPVELHLNATMEQTWQQQQHPRAPMTTAMHAPPHVAMQHKHQHAMHMMQQQQQQQQHIMQHRMQQLQQWQHQKNQQQAAAKTDVSEDDVKTEPTTNIDATTAENWHEHLEEELGHEGLAQGASIEELAQAWAQAELEYEQEYGVNLAEAYQDQQDADSTLYPYEFETTIESQQENLQTRDWMREAREHFERGEVKDAIVCLETFLQLNPEHSSAWFLLGKCHAEQDEDRKAIACLERAVDLDPYNSQALLGLGVSYVNELNHAKALLNLKHWMTHHPKYAGLNVEESADLYGDASSESAFDQAQRLLLQAFKYDPSDASVHEALGVVYNVSRDYDAAAASFRKALELEPNNYSLYNKLGATLANANQSEKALPAYQEALKLRPKYARAWLNMAISFSNLKNYEEAARCYLQTLSLNPSATHCWSYLRIALSMSERYDLIPLCVAQDLDAFAQHYDFVQYK